jgi:Leucine-rich repeat (LRR) protein
MKQNSKYSIPFFSLFLIIFLYQCSPRKAILSELLEKNPSTTSFTLNHKRIQDSLSQLGDYSSIEELTLNYDALDSIPSEFGNLVRLRKLSLYGNSLSYLPDSFSNLIQLESLVLGKNNFTEIPPSIQRLPRLKYLSIDQNRIQLTESDIDILSELPAIEYIDISENPEILETPSNISKLDGIKTILLKKTKLTHDEREKMLKALPNSRLVN